MELLTERLLLRPWRDGDAPALYELAKDPRVGPAAGWPVHESVENSLEIIRTVLSEPETYAVCDRQTGEVLGSIGLMVGPAASSLCADDTEAEIGYWIGVPYWGRGLIPEAVRALQRYAFAELKLDTLWCGYFDGNEKSRRVQEKCGFTYHHTIYDLYWPLMQRHYTEHITCLTRQDYFRR